MQAATDAGSIATAMSYTATSAKDAGVGIDKLTGYIATVSEVSQAGAEQVGTFFKTLFARANAIKEGKLVDPESQEDISSVEVALQNVGIQLRNSQGEFRNTGDVLDEVAGKWKNMSNTTQAAVASAFAGTRQIDKFRILMSNYGTATKYAAEATDSLGFAEEKFNNTYSKSIEASQNRAKASFEQFSQTILNSELVKGTFDVGSGILGFLNAIISKVGIIPTILSGISIGKIFSNAGKPTETASIVPAAA
jgi:TP901 family phage tail tape measure protein